MTKMQVMLWQYPKHKTKLIDAVTSYHNQDSVRLAALNKLPYPDERDFFVEIVKTETNEKLRDAALEKLPLSTEQETYQEIVAFYEAVLQETHQNKWKEPRIPQAVDVLTRLYEKLHLAKTLTRVHEGANPHFDSHRDHLDAVYDEDYNDYNGCGDYMYTGGRHTDTHSDIAHDDYYVVKESGEPR